MANSIFREADSWSITPKKGGTGRERPRRFMVFESLASEGKNAFKAYFSVGSVRMDYKVLATPLHFTVIAVEELSDLKATAIRLKHSSGAEVVKFACADDNKCFGIAFYSPVEDSTGVPHILEHAVLAGSKSFPVKEPFVELLKGSLYTFLNAFTYPDRTVYPVASQNSKDFLNLVRVYLDAVFCPILSKDTFEREGWRFEKLSPEAPVTMSGVVYNEMKGNYGNPSSLNSDAVSQALFPDTAYRFDSGGNPKHIPELTYEQFLDFHRRYYNPAVSKAVIYGDGDLKNELALLDEYYRKSKALPREITWPKQPTFSAPRRYLKEYPASEGQPEEIASFVSVNWKLCNSADSYEILKLRLMEEVLLGTEGAPLYKALIESELGEGLSGHGVGSELYEAYFSIGLQGTAEKSADDIEKLVIKTLEEIHSKGVSKANLAAALNSVEFDIREELNAADKGLRTVVGSFSAWLQGGDPVETHRIDAGFAKLRSELAKNPRMIEELIKRWLLDNTHRVTVTLAPRKELQGVAAQEELDRCKVQEKKLSQSEQAALAKRSSELQARIAAADRPEDLATLPQLALSDLGLAIKKTPFEQIDADTFGAPLATHGITYFSLAWSLNHISQDLLPWVRILSSVMFSVGTTKLTYDDFATKVAEKSGGLGAGISCGTVRTSGEAAAYYLIQGKSLSGSVAPAADLVKQAAFELNLSDPERLLALVREMKSGTEQAIQPRGMEFSSGRVVSHISAAEGIREALFGIEFLLFLRKLEHLIETGWDEVQRKLVQARDLVFSSGGHPQVLFVSPKETWKEAELFAAPFKSSELNKSERALWSPPSGPNEAFLIPAEVNYVSLSLPLNGTGFKHSGSMAVLSNFIRTGWLWTKIRMQGGAYGSAMSYSRDSNLISFGSYRDPNVLKTLEVYRSFSAHLKELAMGDDELRRNIIGAVRNMDAPRTPESRGREAFFDRLYGRSEADRQRDRDEILSTNPETFKELAKAVDLAAARSRIVVLGSENKVKEASENGIALEVSRLL